MARETAGEDLDGFFTSSRVEARDEAVALAESYREFVTDPADAELAQWRGMSFRDFSVAKRSLSFVQELLADWRALYDEPFRGLTESGEVRPEVWADAIAAARTGGAPAAEAGAASAAQAFLGQLSPAQVEAVTYDMDAPEWRAWSNPEFVIHEVGLRLEELSAEATDAALAVVRESLSPEGVARVGEAMALNGFLGDLTELPGIMNDRSYWFSIFGVPGEGDWGWQLFGHHVDLNCVFAGGRQVIAPAFIGAEPALSDGARPALFEAREELALRLMGSLSEVQRSEAVVFASVLDPAMPPGRVHPADERHVAGAFRDNRVVPFEGLAVAALDSAQAGLLLAIVEDFLLLLPADQRGLALADVERWWGQTHLSWYGATDGSQLFYLRIHGPSIIAELDHHAGVWLSNEVPQRFHVHTTLRLPHGADYGKAFRAR
ncbi:DUF3500 domain-containing protein [Demequina sp. NBRC 110057]|uniref:DUF3500 domain-containing protein n=1 Tax=Demequina sp. NBRC 110057 TaxID=1570346 RepID=UPI000A07428A|nr:DUF3500 domain-containing protein [Demequina sp. NBRC 110057]